MSEGLATLRADPGAEAAIRAFHPWVYRDRLPEHDLPTGTWVRVEAGSASAIGLVDRDGAIGVRLFDRAQVPDAPWWQRALAAAVARRTPVAAAGHDAYRLVHGEADGMPGLIADRYGRTVALQVHTPSLRPFLPLIAKILLREASARGVVMREGAGGELRLLAGQEPPPETTVRENGLRFLVNLRQGQKTGLFLDHREHRAAVRDIAEGLRVVNLFSYAGGFSVHALAGGARYATDVDTSEGALRDAVRNVQANDLPTDRHRTVRADVFDWLQGPGRAEAPFDLVILDPPSLARGKRSRDAAVRAYRRLNAAAAALVANGGLLATASCTAQVAPAAFDRAVLRGLSDAGMKAERLLASGAPPDHPVVARFPEGRYLKFRLVRLTSVRGS